MEPQWLKHIKETDDGVAGRRVEFGVWEVKPGAKSGGKTLAEDHPGLKEHQGIKNPGLCNNLWQIFSWTSFC